MKDCLVNDKWKIVEKEFKDLKVIINGAGAAGISLAKIIMEKGTEDIILLDSKGVIYGGRDNLNSSKKEIAKITNFDNKKGELKDVIKDADVFLGSKKDLVLTADIINRIRDVIGDYPLKVHYYENYIEVLLYESEDRILIEDGEVSYMGITHDVEENKIPLEVMEDIYKVMKTLKEAI